jgi:hypothetical protein
VRLDGQRREQPVRVARELLVGVAITLVAFAGVYWQAGQPRDAGETPRLVCPLH